MNTNEAASKVNFRMNRIQRISRFIRLFLQTAILLIILALLVHCLAIVHKMFLSASAHPPNAGSASVPPAGNFKFWSNFLGLILGLFWYCTALKLFRYFEKGILFTAETVRCVQILGAINCVFFLWPLGLFFFTPSPDYHLLWASLSNLFIGFLIIFIGWLLDEARKIREEQELTV